MHVKTIDIIGKSRSVIKRIYELESFRLICLLEYTFSLEQTNIFNRIL